MAVVGAFVEAVVEVLLTVVVVILLVVDVAGRPWRVVGLRIMMPPDGREPRPTKDGVINWGIIVI